MGDRNSRIVNNELCMAVRVNDSIVLRGQTGFDLDGRFHGKGDIIKQADMACISIKRLIEEAGGKPENICKLTVYVTDRKYFEGAFQVIEKHFSGIHPCISAMVCGLALPELLIEIDADAVLEQEGLGHGCNQI